MPQPKLSILIPTYNRADLLSQCLQSTRSVTVDCEIIVQDNASPDSTREIVEFHARKDGRIRYFRNEENLGIVRNFNKAMDAARGEYVSFMGDDDLFLPGNFEQKLPILDARPEIGLIYSAWYLMDEAGRVQGVPQGSGMVAHSYIGGRDEFSDLIQNNHIMLQTVVFRRELWERLGAYSEDPRLSSSNDWDFWLRYTRYEQTAYLNEPFVCIRHHAASYTQTRGIKNQELAVARLGVWKRWLIEHDDPPVLNESVWQRMYQLFEQDMGHWFHGDRSVIERYLREFVEVKQAHDAKMASRFQSGQSSSQGVVGARQAPSPKGHGLRSESPVNRAGSTNVSARQPGSPGLPKSSPRDLSPGLSAGVDRSSWRVLFAYREDVDKDGGAASVMKETACALRALGVHVDISYDQRPDVTGYNVVQVFNIWFPQTAKEQLHYLKQTGIPIVWFPFYLHWCEYTWANIAARVVFDPQRKPDERRRLLEAYTKGTLEVSGLKRWTPNETYSGFYNDLREMLSLVDHVCLTSYREAQMLAQVTKWREKPFTVTPHGVRPDPILQATPDLFRAKFGYDDFVLCVAAVDGRKNQLMLVEALKGTGLKLVLIGPCYEPDYLQLCLREGGDSVLYTDRQPPEVVASAFQAARVHALPSFAEGAALANLEAAVAGRALVVSNRSSEFEYFGDAPYYCDPTDPASIREAVQTAYVKYPQETARWENLSHHIQQTFPWQRTAELSLEAYDKLLAQRGVCDKVLLKLEERVTNSIVVSAATDLKGFDPSVPPLVIEGARGFNFLSVFDWTRRKGWDVLMRAFIEEFAPSEDVALILKPTSSLGYTTTQIVTMLTDFIQNDLGRDPNQTPDIILQDTQLPPERMPNLYRAADCFVLPSRSEGQGRCFQEALAMGLEVIGTDCGVTRDLLTTQNAHLLPCKVVPVPESALQETPELRGQTWDEPDVAHLRALLRQVFAKHA